MRKNELNQSRQKTVIYARVSSKEQAKGGFSIPAQLKLLNKYATDCIFRSNPSTDSGRSRPPIPIDSVHRFRSKPSTDSG